jgi:hypothetical protein
MRQVILTAILGLSLIASFTGCYGGTLARVKGENSRLLDENKCLQDKTLEAENCTPFSTSVNRPVGSGSVSAGKFVGSGTSQPILAELMARVDRQDARLKALIKIALKVLKASKEQAHLSGEAEEKDQVLSDDDLGDAKPETRSADDDLSELEAELRALEE